jgi:hypothetical protein
MVDESKTTVGISGADFTINGKLTYTPESGFGAADPHLRGKLLMLKTANCIFDDARYGQWATRENPYFGYVHWDYPDSPWDPDRHTDEFIAALDSYREHGLTMVSGRIASVDQQHLHGKRRPEGGVSQATLARTDGYG